MAKLEQAVETSLIGRWNLGIPEVWVRFLTAILGLVLAFAAALFSTASRESGNLWATLILATIALILAAVVGLTTVPYLARRVAVAGFQDAFEYDITRVGIFYAVAVVLIAVAAFNTGNNLLYIVVAALLAAILVSGIASAVVLNRLDLDVRVPEHVFAGKAVIAKILLCNPRRTIPSYSISVTTPKASKSGRRWQWAPAVFAFPPRRAPEKQWFRVSDLRLRQVSENPSGPGIMRGTAYFPYIPAKSELTADLELHFERRGVYQQKTFGLSTRFPFAFLVKTRRVSLPRELVVFPSVEPADEFFEVLPLITGEFESFVRGRGNDLYRIREYLPEDSARHVDWKASAKSSTLMVREFSREDERKLRIVFDNPEPGVVPAKIYEKAVGLAASLVWHFSGRNTEISFVSQGYNGSPDVYEFLGHLAVVEPRAGASVIDTLSTTGDYNVVITTRPRGTVPTQLWACSYFVFLDEKMNG